MRVLAEDMASITSRLSDRVERTVERARTRTSTPGRRTRTAVVLGRIVGVMMLVCFATGLYSHVLQSPPGWLPLFPRPAQLYSITQGTHVLTGLAMVPLLLAKLWSVYPRLFQWPPITGPLSALARMSTAVLVGASLLEVALGVMNIAQWYPFPFSFRRVHFVLAWIVVGCILFHVAVKLPTIIGFWRRHPSSPGEEPDVPARPTWPEQAPPSPAEPPTKAEVVSRRAALFAVGASAGTIALLAGGQTFPALEPLTFLAPRRPSVGPQDLPINRTAREAGVLETAVSPSWQLQVLGPGSEEAFTLGRLRDLPQHTVCLPISCVEGWSRMAEWSGVPLRNLLAAVGAGTAADARITSLQVRGAFSVTLMRHEYIQDPATLVALMLNGAPLDLDHGYPARIIAPGRPGVLQTKWLSRIEVTA